MALSASVSPCFTSGLVVCRAARQADGTYSVETEYLLLPDKVVQNAEDVLGAVRGSSLLQGVARVALPHPGSNAGKGRSQLFPQLETALMLHLPHATRTLLTHKDRMAACKAATGRDVQQEFATRARFGTPEASESWRQQNDALQKEATGLLRQCANGPAALRQYLLASAKPEGQAFVADALWNAVSVAAAPAPAAAAAPAEEAATPAAATPAAAEAALAVTQESGVGSSGGGSGSNKRRRQQADGSCNQYWGYEDGDDEQQPPQQRQRQSGAGAAAAGASADAAAAAAAAAAADAADDAAALLLAELEQEQAHALAR